MERLHRHKDHSYGDAWRKRGEVLSIFCNIARKQDRLDVAASENGPTAAEPLADTVADLCVYAAKYLTWLAERDPEAFAAQSRVGSAGHYAAGRGPEALVAVFERLADTERAVPDSFDVARKRAASAFSALEAGLIAQSEGVMGALTTRQKVAQAWNLTAASAWALAILANDDAMQLDDLRKEIDRMDERATS